MVGVSEVQQMGCLTDQFTKTLASPDGEVARKYLQGRKLDTVAEEARLGVVGGDLPEGYGKYRGMLSIPFVNGVVDVTAIRFRRISGEGPKYLQPHGSPVFPYRPWSVGGVGVACITEGELDALSLVAAGIRGVVGFPGASTWRDHYQYLFDAADRVLVFADPDDAGQKFADNVLNTMRSARVVTLPEGEDVNSLLVSRGVDYLKGLVEG